MKQTVPMPRLICETAHEPRQRAGNDEHRMRLRMVSVGLALILGGMAVTALPALARRKNGLKIKNPQVSPNRVNGGGGTIAVSTEIVPGDLTIDRVDAVAEVPGSGRASASTLTRRRSGAFKGQVKVPVNYENHSVKGTVYVIVTTSTGERIEKPLGQVKVGPFDTSGPPPPPPAY